MKQYVAELNLMHFEVSAKSGENISSVFESIAQKLPRLEQNLASARSGGMRRMELAGSRSAESKSGCC